MNAVDMLDVTSGCLDNVPRSLKIKRAGYVTGSPNIRWAASDWEKNPSATVRIDQSNGTDPRIGNVKDIERGAALIPEAITWAKNRRDLGLRSTFYISASSLIQCEEAVKAAGISEWVTYWLADWRLSRTEAIAELGGRIVAIQYASPATNPDTFIPGTKLPLHVANVDLSVCLDTWHPTPAPQHRHIHIPRPHRPHKPHHKVIGGTTGGTIATAIVALAWRTFHVHLTPVEGGAIATAVAALVGYYVPSGKSNG